MKYRNLQVCDTLAMDAEAIHAEQIGYNPPDFESCYSLARKQDAHDFAVRHAIMLEARDASEKIEYLPGANARGISKATALLINAAKSRSMVEWKHCMTHEEAETEFRMLTLRIADDLKVHRQQGKWVYRAGTDGYPGFRSLLHLKALGHWNSGLQEQKDAFLDDGAISYLMYSNLLLCDHCDSCGATFQAYGNSQFRPACICFTDGRFGKLIEMVEKSAAAAVLPLMQAESNRIMDRDVSFDELNSYAHWKMQHDEFPPIDAWNQGKHPHPHWTAAIKRFAPTPLSVTPLAIDLDSY